MNAFTRRAILLILGFLPAISQLLSQNYVEVGTGTVANTMPIYSYWNYSWSSLIYNHTDLGAAKSISKIGLNCTNGPKTVTNQKIYFKLTSNSVFSAANYEDPTNNGYTLAFQGDLTFVTGWNEITLSTPIPYDGALNLAIHWENRWGTSYGPVFNSTTSAINNNKNCGNDSFFPLPSQTGYLNPYPSSLTNMRFFYAGSGPATPTNPIPADNSTVVSVSTNLSWVLGANTTTYDLYFGTNPLNLPLVVNNAAAGAGIYTYTPPALLADSTTHYWKVVAKNGSQVETSPVWKFKTEVVIDQFPYNEGFEDSLVFHSYPVVSAWIIDPDVSWYQYDTLQHSGSLCAKTSWYTSSGQAIMRSPKVLLPPNYSISYYWKNTSLNKVAGHDTTYFEVSGNGGQTWVAVDILAPTTSNQAYVQRIQSLDAFAGNNCYFRFRHKTDLTSGACNVYLDDISIYQTGSVPTLSVTPSNQNVTSPAGSTTFTVASNSAWTVLSDQAWCTVTPSGSGNGSIIANYLENTTASQRVANITVTVSGLQPVIVTVTQNPAGSTLSVSPTNQNVTAPAGSTNFTVTTNSAWTAGSDQTWCTVTPSGSGNGIITANYTENTGLIPRTVIITVTVSGLPVIDVTVTQEAAVPFLGATPLNQDVTYQAGTTNFAISSNLSWSAISDAGWCTVTPSGTGSGTVFATYAENTLAAIRIAHVTISASGVSDITVTVTQLGPAAVLSITPQVQEVTYQAGMTTFAVTSNAEWTATSDAAWCVPTASGSGSGVINATYGQNETMVTRNAHITVDASGVSPVILQIIQHPSGVGIQEPGIDPIKIYPNPSKGIFLLNTGNFSINHALIEILDNTGKCLKKIPINNSETKINVAQLGSGVYFLRLSADDRLYYSKFVIE
jgi:hypothetical protein